MTREQEANLTKLDKIVAELQQQANLLNLAGYEASPAELYKIDLIAHLSHEIQKLARL